MLSCNVFLNGIERINQLIRNILLVFTFWCFFGFFFILVRLYMLIKTIKGGEKELVISFIIVLWEIEVSCDKSIINCFLKYIQISVQVGKNFN